MTNTKTNFKDCHIRIFDTDGMIYSASPDMDPHDLTHEVIELLRESHENGDKYSDGYDDGYDEYCAEFDTAGYLRTLVDDAPGDMSFDDHVAAYQKYPDSTLHVVDEILERLREIFDDDFIFDHIRVDADMPGVQLRNSVICEFIQMKVATFALGHHVYLGDGVFCDQMTE